jgi:hypothetical protein
LGLLRGLLQLQHRRKGWQPQGLATKRTCAALRHGHPELVWLRKGWAHVYLLHLLLVTVSITVSI